MMMSVAWMGVFPLVCLFSSIDIDLSQQIVLESTIIREPAKVCVITIGQKQVRARKETGPSTNTEHCELQPAWPPPNMRIHRLGIFGGGLPVPHMPNLKKMTK